MRNVYFIISYIIFSSAIFQVTGMDLGDSLVTLHQKLINVKEFLAHAVQPISNQSEQIAKHKTEKTLQNLQPKRKPVVWPGMPKKHKPSSTPKIVSEPQLDIVSAQEIGKQALEYTNEFRKEHGKPPLQWNQALADLSTEHSKNMAEGVVKFGHAGFADRAARFPFRYQTAAENVYMTTARDMLARRAVDGWINSPGHRANLLGNFRFCGIGIYQGPQRGAYFTQLFGTPF